MEDGVEVKELFSGHVEFEMPVRYSSGNVKSVVRNVSLKVSERPGLEL